MDQKKSHTAPGVVYFVCVSLYIVEYGELGFVPFLEQAAGLFPEREACLEMLLCGSPPPQG